MKEASAGGDGPAPRIRADIESLAIRYAWQSLELDSPQQEEVDAVLFNDILPSFPDAAREFAVILASHGDPRVSLLAVLSVERSGIARDAGMRETLTMLRADSDIVVADEARRVTGLTET